jgi:hypothetical protein
MGSHKPLQHSRPPRRRTVPQDSPPDDVPAEGRLLQQLPVAPTTESVRITRVHKGKASQDHPYNAE